MDRQAGLPNSDSDFAFSKSGKAKAKAVEARVLAATVEDLKAEERMAENMKAKERMAENRKAGSADRSAMSH